MKTTEAKQITGSLSKPSKMPGHAYGLPAKECKTGGKLQKVKGSTCYGCYALKGCYVFKVVQAAQYKRLKAIRHPLWVKAMAMQINSKKTKFFRWHDSGDVQDLKHLAKIFEVARRSPDVQHWLPTREAWTIKYQHKAPENLKLIFSMPMVNQEAAGKFNYTSTVVTDSKKATCPAPNQDNECKDCRACWDKKVKNVAYLAHQFRMILMWHHPKYYAALAKIRKQFEKEQADKRASERASRRVGGPTSNEPTSDQASDEEASKQR